MTVGWTKSSSGAWMRLAAARCLMVSLLLGLLAGCDKGGVGDPCIPEDEYQAEFGGYSETEVNIESRSFQCETRVCLVNHFRGRVSCPYGQAAGEKKCVPPDGVGEVNVPVAAQLVKRPPSSAVYCSCRCDGARKDAPYCECPSGFQCRPLIDDIGLGNSQLAGSYCVRSGSDDENIPAVPVCKDDPNSPDYCGDSKNFYR